MYKSQPKESFLHRTMRHVEDGLKVYGTARGVYEVLSATATGLRGAYQIAAPALAML